MRLARVFPSILLLAVFLLFAVAPGCGAESVNPAGDDLRRAFPEQAAVVLAQSETFLATDEGFARGLAAAEGVQGLEVRLPRDAAGTIRMRSPSGFEARVREVGAMGESAVAEQAVSHRRKGGTSFWSSAAGGVEEWLHLAAGVARRGQPVATWEVEGGALREADGAVEVVDAAGAVQIRVTAPIAYAEGGRPIAARLTARGGTIALAVDADLEAVLVDPAWTAVPPMSAIRAYHVSVLLPNGKVLVAGGEASTQQSTAELYDPATNTWKATASMSTPRSYYANGAVKLASGKVLVAGGYYGPIGTQATAEIYDGTTSLWTSAGSMLNGRDLHTLTLLSSGLAVAAGGRTQGGGATTATVDVYDPVANAWTATNPMASARYYHAAVLLGNGKVFVIGGQNPSVALAATELYDPVTKTWAAGPSMAVGRTNFAAIWIPSVSKVLVTGGGMVATELYSQATNTWSAGPPTSSARSAPTLTLLQSGKVLVTGNGTAEIYDPVTSTWAPFSSMVASRSQHAATLLGSGAVLVSGGLNLSSAELFAPLAGGGACLTGSDCASGNCVDGFCCNTACTSLCQACSAAKTGGVNGTCGSVIAATDPDNDCAAQAASTCGANGFCDGGGKCQLFVSGTACAAASCSGSTLTPASSCNGGGTCVAGAAQKCDPYVCSGAACKTSCAVNADCTAGNLCINTKCGAPLGDGAACTAAGQCSSGNCVDGVCCNTACSAGACDACSVAAGALKDGTCALLTGTACDDGMACTQADTCTMGVCGGAVMCAAIDACHAAGACDAQGACTTPVVMDGAACDDSNGCTQVDVCLAGKCVGGSPVVCGPPDGCHDAGTCNVKLGACDYPVKKDGAACDDKDACTPTDSCLAGVCTPGAGMACPEPDACHTGGACKDGVCPNDVKVVPCSLASECETIVLACDVNTGACVKSTKPDGSPCGVGGSCLGGTCDGSAGTGSAGTGSAGTGSAGTGSAGTGSAGSASTGAAGSAATGASSAAAGSGGAAGDGTGDTAAGCGCSTVGTSESRAPWLLFGLLLVVRRRRQSRAA
jgi:hypothetical protein